jgi:urea transport system permease protein
MAPDKSLEAVVWVAVGGRGTLLGPILGALGINWLKSYATHAFAEQWPYILGLLFVLVTLLLPGGLVSLPAQIRALLAKWRPRTGPTTPLPQGTTANGTASPPA